MVSQGFPADIPKNFGEFRCGAAVRFVWYCPRNRTYIVPIYLFYHIAFGFASRPRTLLKNLQKRHEGAFLAEALKKTGKFRDTK